MKNRRPNATQFIVNVILRRGNEPGLIAEWFDGMRKWTEANRGPDAAALKTWLGIVNARPFYTAAELAKFWPALKLTLGLVDRIEEPPSPHRLANELKFYGLPFRIYDRNGKPTEYFNVERCAKWRDFQMTQEEFENVILNG